LETNLKILKTKYEIEKLKIKSYKSEINNFSGGALGDHQNE